MTSINRFASYAEACGQIKTGDLLRIAGPVAIEVRHGG